MKPSIIAAAFFITSSIAVAAPANKFAICIDSKGVAVAKPKCAKNETVFSLATIKSLAAQGTLGQGPKGDKGDVGPQGPAGATGSAGKFDITSCTVSSGIGRTGFPTTVSCADPANQFMLSWGITPNFALNSKLMLNRASIQGTGARPTGITVNMNAVDDSNEFYSITIVCCSG